MPEPITTSVYTRKASTLFFARTLPPLPPGHYINKNGVPSYVLQVVSNYYQKAESDYRYLRKHNETIEAAFNTIEGMQAIPIITVRPDASEKFIGFKFSNDSVNKNAGFAWFDVSGNILGSISRVGSVGDIIITPNSIGNPYNYITIKSNGNIEYKNSGISGGELDNSGNITGYPPLPTDSEFLLGIYGVKNQGDHLTGVYTLKPDTNSGNGKLEFYRKYPDDTYRRIVTINSNTKPTPNEPDDDRVGIILENQHVIQAPGAPIDSDSLINLGYMITHVSQNYTSLTERNRLITKFSEYDAIVKQSGATGYREYLTVREALLAGARKIRVMAGTYSASGFWPQLGDSYTMSEQAIIEGDVLDETIISGNSAIVSLQLAASKTIFKNLIFKADSGTLVAFQFSSSQEIEFDNCIFTKISTNPGIGLNASWTSDNNYITIRNCKFFDLDKCIHTSGLSATTDNAKFLKIYNSKFYNFDYALDINSRNSIQITDCEFLLTNTNSIGINWVSNDVNTTTDKFTKLFLNNNIFYITGSDCKALAINLNATAALNGSRFFIQNNTFKAAAGITTPHSIWISDDTSLSTNKFYMVVMGNEFYNFTGSGVTVDTATTNLNSVLIMSGHSQISTVAGLADLDKSNIIV